MTNQQAPEALRFTKKPVTIEAIQWTGNNLREVITFTDGPPDTRSQHAGMAWDDYRDLVARDGLKIYTLEGKMLANPGDWIIRGVKGEYYPCKPDIFEATYSPAAPVEAQQPAPSAAAALPEGWVPLVITHEGQYPEEVAYGPQILMDRLGKWLRKYFDHVVASKAQPSPTPQTDSQPDVDLIARGMRWEDCEALMKESCAQAGVQWDEEKEPQSIAINVMQRLANAAHKVGFKLGLERMAAARAPADSVTAPARGVVSMPASFEAARFSMRRPHGNGCRIAFHFGDAAEGEAWMKAAITATPPAQAADSVLEDAARLWDAFVDEWCNEVGVDKIVNIMGGADKLKAVFLDAARKQGANHD